MFFSSSTINSLAIDQLQRGARQFNRKGRTLTGFAGDKDPPAVRVDNFLGDGESETRRAGFRAIDVPLRITLEQALANLRRNSGTGIAHFDPRAVVRRAG